MSESRIKILSVGGSIIIPKTGFDIKFLRGFKKLLEKKIKQGFRFIIICGGGQTARTYQAAAKKIDKLRPVDVDWIGIHATRLNAHFMRTFLCEHAHPVVGRDYTQKFNWKTPVLVVSGWKPGCSTDFDAVKFAELYGGDAVINLSNINYVYDSDPNKNPKAKKMESASWKEFRKIVGNKWSPGANLPFDPVASQEAEKLGLTVAILNGKNLTELEKALDGKKFKGTVVN